MVVPHRRADNSWPGAPRLGGTCFALGLWCGALAAVGVAAGWLVLS